MAECDLIGIWEINMEDLNFTLNLQPNDTDYIILDDLIGIFDLQLVDDDKVFIPGFISFQYGDEAGELSVKNKMVPKLLRMLKASGLPPPVFKDASPMHPPSNSEVSPTHGVKEEDKDKDKEEDKEEVKEKEEGPKFNLDAKSNEIFSQLPLITKETITAKYPQSFLKAGVEECVSFHLNEPGSAKWQPGVWGKKITSWLLEKKRREGGTSKTQAQSLDDLDLSGIFKPKVVGHE